MWLVTAVSDSARPDHDIHVGLLDFGQQVSANTFSALASFPHPISLTPGTYQHLPSLPSLIVPTPLTEENMKSQFNGKMGDRLKLQISS